MTTCVFCGKPIEPGEERAGRPPMAAHAACADAALADDAHWDEVASRAADPVDEVEDASSAPDARSRAGCLTITLGVVLPLALVALQVAA